MPRFRAEEVENYGGSGGGGFFSLTDDGEIARVRFMYNGIEDVEGFAVHEVEVDGRKRWVNCLREYNQPVDDCPFCKAGKFQTVKLYIPVYDVDEQKVKIWERGKKFFSKLSSLCARYPNLVSHICEIERHGKKGDNGTNYEIYEVSQDDTTLEDLPEIPNVLGGLVLDKSFEEMEDYLDNGYFPDAEEAPVRRRETRREEARPAQRDRNVVRRTPSRVEKF